MNPGIFVMGGGGGGGGGSGKGGSGSGGDQGADGEGGGDDAEGGGGNAGPCGTGGTAGCPGAHNGGGHLAAGDPVDIATGIVYTTDPHLARRDPCRPDGPGPRAQRRAHRLRAPLRRLGRLVAHPGGSGHRVALPGALAGPRPRGAAHLGAALHESGGSRGARRRGAPAARGRVDGGLARARGFVFAPSQEGQRAGRARMGRRRGRDGHGAESDPRRGRIRRAEHELGRAEGARGAGGARPRRARRHLPLSSRRDPLLRRSEGGGSVASLPAPARARGARIRSARDRDDGSLLAGRARGARAPRGQGGGG